MSIQVINAFAKQASGDPAFSSVVLLMGFEGSDGSTSFVDESSSGKTVTAVGNAQIDTSQFKYGASSLQMDASGDCLTLADSADWDFGSGDFTVEHFMRMDTSVTSVCGLVSHFTDSSATSAWQIQKSGNDLSFTFYDSGGNFRSCGGSAGTWNANQWYHVAIDRSGTTFRVYRDGSVVATQTLNYTMQNGSGVLQIGRYTPSAAPRPWPGWMDEVRITKGFARYAGAFTPPAAAFPRA